MWEYTTNYSDYTHDADVANDAELSPIVIVGDDPTETQYGEPPSDTHFTEIELAILATASPEENAGSEQAESEPGNSDPIEETDSEPPEAATGLQPPPPPPTETLQSPADDEGESPEPVKNTDTSSQTEPPKPPENTTPPPPEDKNDDRSGVVPPIELVEDSARAEPRSFWNQTTGSEFEETLSVAAMDGILSIAEGDTSPAREADTVHSIALQGLFYPEDTASLFGGRDAVGEVDIAALKAQAANLSPAQVVDHFITKLEDYTTYLSGGEQPTNWPEAADARRGFVDHQVTEVVANTAKVIQYSLDMLQEQLPDPEATKQRFDAWLSGTANLMFHNDRIGLASHLINFASQDTADALMGRLTEKMSALKDAGNIEEYREYYSAMTRTFKDEKLAAFVAQNERLDPPLIPGARREVEEVEDITFIRDYFDQQKTYTAQLAGGQHVELPQTEFRIRQVERVGVVEVGDRVFDEKVVSYNTLDNKAKAAIEIAWQAEDTGRLREETLPHYRRLIMDSANNEYKLHTVAFSDGGNRCIHATHDYSPDHVSYNPPPELHGPVVSARLVSEGYMVLKTQEHLPPQETSYRDPEPNFFGPGEQNANAFWISGVPRAVVDAPDSIKYYEYTGEVSEQGQVTRRPRWVIVPVQYYQVETQRPDPEPGEDRPRYGP